MTMKSMQDVFAEMLADEVSQISEDAIKANRARNQAMQKEHVDHWVNNPLVRSGAAAMQGVANASFNPFGYIARANGVDTKPLNPQNAVERALEKAGEYGYDAAASVLAGNKLKALGALGKGTTKTSKVLQALFSPNVGTATLEAASGGGLEGLLNPNTASGKILSNLVGAALPGTGYGAVKNLMNREAKNIISDATGAPLKVFHGSNAKNIEVFDGTKSSRKIKTKNDDPTVTYFTSNKGVAGTYGDNVYERYLKMKNPYIVDYKGKHFNDLVTTDKGLSFGKKAMFAENDIDSINEIVKYAKDKGYDGVIAKNIKDGANESALRGIYNDAEQKLYKDLKKKAEEELYGEYKKIEPNSGSLKSFYQYMGGKRNGKEYMARRIVDKQFNDRTDSLVTGDDYVVFSPEQIISNLKNQSSAINTSNILSPIMRQAFIGLLNGE